MKLGIYVNKNLRLDNIQVYGFDYDYTLAHYSANLQSLIYDLAKEHMVNDVSFRLFLLMRIVKVFGLILHITNCVFACGSFSFGTLRFAWILSMIPLFPSEDCTMISSKGVS